MTPSLASQPKQTADLKVLIIEDDPNVRLGCEQAMQLAGIPVQAVASAEAGQRLVGPDSPGVVVTDMRLPGMDGMQLLRERVAAR